MENNAHDLEDVVLLESVFEKIRKDNDSRGYILVRTDPEYQNYGFKALGFDYRKVSDSASLDTHLEAGDFEILKNHANTDTKLSPYVKHATPPEPGQKINDVDVFYMLDAANAQNFFLIGNQGGVTVALEYLGMLRRLKKIDYIASISLSFFQEKGIMPASGTREE